MSDQNPYSVTEPRTESIGRAAGAACEYNLGRIALHLRLVAWTSILLVFSASFVVVQTFADVMPEKASLYFGNITLAAYLVLVLGGLFVVHDVSKDWRAWIVLAILTFAPCVGLFVVGGVCQYGYEVLQQHGWRWGLLRTRKVNAQSRSSAM